MPQNEQPAPTYGNIRITDTKTGAVTEHETYAIVTDAIGRLHVQTGSGVLIGPFEDHDDAFDYLLTLSRSI